jgi:hypothetical protein
MTAQRRPRTTTYPLPPKSPTEIRSSTSTRTGRPGSGSSSDYEEDIRFRAYQLWEQRGRRDGFGEEDWLDAEKEIIERYKQGAA